MLMSVMERTREIGMMSAMGMKKKEITRLFILEGAFIGMIGAFVGCVLGGLASWYLEVHGWAFAELGDTLNKITAAVYPVKDVFYADLTINVLVMTFFLGILVSILASFYPARKAAKMDPIEALRHL
jgi:putative ABC transport system permease protein